MKYHELFKFNDRQTFFLILFSRQWDERRPLDAKMKSKSSKRHLNSTSKKTQIWISSYPLGDIKI